MFENVGLEGQKEEANGMVIFGIVLLIIGALVLLLAWSFFQRNIKIRREFGTSHLGPAFGTPGRFVIGSIIVIVIGLLMITSN